MRKSYDSQASVRIANFVRGRTGIPRAMIRAAFPSISPTVIAILSALGHVEGGEGLRSPDRLARLELAREERAARLAAQAPERAAKKEAARLAKVNKLEERLAKLRAEGTLHRLGLG